MGTGCGSHQPRCGRPDAAANPRRAPGTGTKAGHDRALGSMAMAHQPLAAVFGVLVGMATQEGCDLRLDSLRQQGWRALAQNFGRRVGELGWLDQLDDSILGHGVSLLRWRSGGSNTPTIRPLNPSRRNQLPRIPFPYDRAGVCRHALSSSSMVSQRMAASFGIEFPDGVVDGLIEVVRSGEGLVSEMMPLQVAPETLDMSPLGEGGTSRLAGVDRTVVEDQNEGLD